MSHVSLLGQAARIANPAIDYHAIAPEVVLAGTIFVVLLFALFLPRARRWWAMPVSFAGVAGAFAATLTLIGTRRATFGGSYVVDNFAVLFKVFFTVVAMVILAVSLRYL